MKKITSVVLFFFTIGLSAQIKGTITDNNQQPIPFVDIIVKGTTKGTVSDDKGKFEINNISGEQTLIVSYIGYKTREIKVVAPKNNLNILLYEGNELLQEVVVKGNKNRNRFSRKKTAYVSKLPLKDIDNSSVYSTVTNELMESQIVTDFNEAMTNATGIYKLWEATGSNPINGTGSYASRGFSVKPRLVDGISGAVFTSVDPSYIERIEVVKGPAATLFGSTETALGGLINVVTKKPFKGTKGTVNYTMGSFGLHRGSIDYNTPLGDADNLFLRVNASYLTKNSFQDAGFRKTFFIAPSLSFEVNDRLKMSLGMEFSKTKQTNAPMLFIRRGTKLLYHSPKEMGVDPKKSFTSNDIFLENPTYTSRFIADYKLSDQWNSKTAFSGTYAQTYGYYHYQFDGGSLALSGVKAIGDGFSPFLNKADAGLKKLKAIGANNPSHSMYKLFLQTQGQFAVLNGIVGNANFMAKEADNLTKQTAFTRVISKRDGDAIKFNVQQNFNGDFKLGDVRNRMVLGLDFVSSQFTNNNVWKHPFGDKISKMPELLNYLQIAGQASPVAEGARTGLLRSFAGFPYFDAFIDAKGNVIPNSFTPNAKYDVKKKDLDAVFDGTKAERLTTSSKVLSAYVSDVINITPSLIVNLGARIDHFIQEGNTVIEGDNYSVTTFSPSAGILFQPIKNKLSLFGNYQTGYINNEANFDRSTNTLQVPDPTQSKQFEGGFKTNFYNGKLNFGASYYHITVNNLMDRDPRAPIFPRGIYIAETVSKGFELEVSANPVKGLNLRASFSKNDSKYTDTYSKQAFIPDGKGGYKKDKNGKLILGRDVVEYKNRRPTQAGADMIYNFWADYKFPKGTFAENFGIGAGFNGASEHLTRDNSFSGTFTLPSYTLFNASVYYNTDKFRVAVKANNITDVVYYTGWTTINAQESRAILGTITYKF